MPRFRWVARFAFQAALISAAGAFLAQAQHGHDHDNPGHGHMPPGQAKQYDHGERHMPPGQARKHGDWRFHGEDRDRFYAHYSHDAEHWRHHHRPVFVPGQYLPSGYYVRPVPRTYWVGVVAPPPPGYMYGYYGGYVVAYDPTTRMIADAIDLAVTAASR